MGAVVPVLIVVVFWAIVFCFAFGAFQRWLKVPTEAELEAEHEHEEAQSKGKGIPTAAGH